MDGVPGGTYRAVRCRSTLLFKYLKKDFMKIIIASLISSFVCITLIAQNLGITETISYINSKLENCPCRYEISTSIYNKSRVVLQSDGYLSVYTTVYRNGKADYNDYGNQVSEVKGTSLNYSLVECETYGNVGSSRLKLYCLENGNCVKTTTTKSGTVYYNRILYICFSADYETQRSLINAFKHLINLIHKRGTSTQNSDPFADENYYRNKNSNSTSSNNTTTVTNSNEKISKLQSSGQAATSSIWITKKGEVGNFYIDFPSAPSYQPGEFHGWTTKDKNGQVSYLMNYWVAPSSGQMTIAAAEKYLLPSLMEGDILILKTYLSYAGYKAIDFLYKSNSQPILYKRGRILHRGQEVYILQVYYYHQELVNYNKFVESLRLY